MYGCGICPRCEGPIVDAEDPVEDSPLCITCGWRRSDVAPDVQAEVEAFMGKDVPRPRSPRKRIGTGKPPLSGWEREKRRKDRADGG